MTFATAACWVCAASSLWIRTISASILPRQTSSSNTSLTLYDRTWQASIVLGDYLYIHGGLVTMWQKGNYSTPTPMQQNATLAISLTSSWTNETVTFHQIPAGDEPAVTNGGLWMGDSADSFYAYGGGLSESSSDEWNRELWKFTASGNSGSWSQVMSPPQSGVSNVQPLDAIVYASGNGLGFDLGYGFDNPPTPGTVQYNFTSGLWSTIFTSNLNATYAWEDGQVAPYTAHFATELGPAGLLFVLVGIEGNLHVNLVYIYEPLSQQWYLQNVTGDIPEQVTDPCFVGLQGDEGTYEMFMYAGATGYADSSIAASGDVYVLSIPSFHWIKQDYPPTVGRYHFSCNIVGKRQLITVGGWCINEDQMEAPDPLPNGLAVFDLSAMEWRSSYDPNLDPYVTPSVVKAYTAKHPYPDEWSDPILKTWLVKDESAKNASSKSGTSTKSGSSNVGAIAGGVVGGVVGLAIAVAIVWIIFRRRKKPSIEPQDSIADPQQPEMDGADARVALPAIPARQALDGIPVSELEVKHEQSELAGRPIHELGND